MGNSKRAAYPNRSKLLDTFHFAYSINVINQQILKDLYLNDGLSASQIATKFNASKSHVLSRLHKLGISDNSSSRRINPKNYRLHNPPYGFHVKNGELKQYRPEAKICQQILKLKNDGQMTFREIGRELESRKYRNRQGKVSWHHSTVSQICNRWNNLNIQ